MQKIKDPIYIVKANESLNQIAEKFDINPTKILIDNGCTPKMIKENVVLLLKSNKN